MNILWLTIPAAFALAFLIFHCYLYRGLRVTSTFFLICFLYSIFKENAVYYFEGIMRNSSPPYEILNPHIQIFHAPLAICIGWMFVFYVSWCLAERILKRINFFSKKLFPTLLLGGLITASISYCVEATGINAGWWHWTRKDSRLTNFFIEGVTLSPIEGWFFTFMVVLVPYFLIECSKYRNRKWKYIFIIPSLFYIAIRLSGFYLIAMIVECLAITLLLYLTLRSHLFLMHHLKNNHSHNSINHPYILHFMDRVPLFMVFLMLIIMISIDLRIAGRPELFISKLPIIFFTLLSIKEIPFSIIFSLAFVITVCGRGKFLVLAIPPISFLILLIFSKWLQRDMFDHS